MKSLIKVILIFFINSFTFAQSGWINIDQNRQLNLESIKQMGDLIVYQIKDNSYFPNYTRYVKGDCTNFKRLEIVTNDDWNKQETYTAYKNTRIGQELTLACSKLLTSNEDKLRLEVEESKRKQAELQEQLLVAQQQSNQLTSTSSTQALALNENSIRNAHALIIGNSAYIGGGRLPNPVNDARLMASKLRTMGFKVTIVEDANRTKLVSALGQFNRSAATADLTLFFYSGHGVQIFGTNYILPVDLDQSDLAKATLQGISLNSIVEQFMPGKTKLVFLDACRTNPLAVASARGFSKGLAPISASEGTLIAFAAKDGQEAADGLVGKNSPFTSALVAHLSDPDDIAVVLRKVRSDVMKNTGNKQQPWEYGSLTGGALVLSAIKQK